MIFTQRLKERAQQVDARLLAHLGQIAGLSGQSYAAPERLLAAMRHAVLGGGKRIRPCLVLECAALFNVAPSAALDTAAALELVHCYSLAHDDLPAMDNDEVRRGQPTVWKAFDDWTAILAGDALQTLAFEILAKPATHPNAEVRTELVLALARASGAAGMAGGQALDLEADKLGHGRSDYISPLFEIDPKTIRRGLDDFNDGGALSDVRQRKKGVDGKAKSNNTPS